MIKILRFSILFLIISGFYSTINAQNVVVNASITSLRLSDGSDCVAAGSSDPRIWARVSGTGVGWSSEWSFQTDNVGTTTGSNGYCLGSQTYGGSCGWTNQAEWSATLAASANFQVGINGQESDPIACDADDGRCGGYSGAQLDAGILATWAPACGAGYNSGSTTRSCTSSDFYGSSTQVYTAGWRMRYHFSGLSDANAGGTISLSVPANTTICAGGTISQINGNSLLSDRFSSRQWQVRFNGGAFGAAGGTNTGQNYTPPAGTFNTPGIYEYRRALTYCTDFSGGTATVYSNTICVVVFPTPPTITATANTCNAMFALPSVTAVTSFSVQYSL
ncbi:MAG TPA: hypothetical protein PLX60_10065, partial [Chitinophagales bacterium]|nr:hypothetical protein [Chitinophagales bacterium]